MKEFDLKHLEVKPGDIVATRMGGYQHWSLVTDRYCSAGKLMLISATKRTGTVEEEPWDIVIGSRETVIVDMALKRSVLEALSIARSHIGEWKYAITSNNCEHFIKTITGYEVTSKQVQAAAIGGLAGVGLVAAFAESPSALKFLGGAVLVAAIAVAVVQVTDKQ